MVSTARATPLRRVRVVGRAGSDRCRAGPGRGQRGGGGKVLSWGTAAWAAPERLRGGPATCASDVYSFGVTVYEVRDPP